MKPFQNFAEAIARDCASRLDQDNFVYVARLEDGTQINRAQVEQLHLYGVTTLNDGRVIQRGEPLFCC